VNVISMQNDKSSILNKYQELITLRNNEPVLQYGEYEILEYEGEYISYTRSYKKDKITVIINFGPENKLDLSLPKGARILMGSLPLKTNGFIIYRN